MAAAITATIMAASAGPAVAAPAKPVIQSHIEEGLSVRAVALRSTDPFRKWNAALARHSRQSRGEWRSMADDAWHRTVARIRTLPEDLWAEETNAVFNSIPYRDDRTVWRRDDYWAAPREFLLQNAGDCEDYALAKYFALREAGIAAERLYILVIKDLRRREMHAVLAMHVGGRVMVLDNLYARPQPLSHYAAFVKPLYAVNETGAWILTGTPDQPAVLDQRTASGSGHP